MQNIILLTITILIMPIAKSISNSTLYANEYTEHVIGTNFAGALFSDTGDVDNDGDIDVIGVAYWDNEISWWENDGNQNFTKHIVTTTLYGASSAHIVDLDLDGDMDFLAGSQTSAKILWWENDGNQNFNRHIIPYK